MVLKLQGPEQLLTLAHCSLCQLEAALLKAARQALHPLQQEARGEDATPAERDVPEMQAVLRSGMNMIQFRELTVSLLSSLAEPEPVARC